jgi:iron complex outermembrane receptor protein
MMSRHNLQRGVSVCALTFALGAAVAFAQEALPEIEVGAAEGAPPAAAEAGPPGFSKEKLKLPVYREPTGQTFTTIHVDDFKNTPLFTIRELLQYSPGLSFKQGNGPRDIVISIRGSSARNGFGVRNIVLLEDGFPVTQPDGLGRTDLTDPHAYAAVDVYRGPSSALFGNFANGGAINFRTRSGAEIDGVETGHEFGSFGYLNNYTAIGKRYENFDIAVFASDVRSDGFIQHFQGDTQTVNLTARYKPTPDDTLVFKGIHNELFGNLDSRLSLNQFYLNPFQRGCALVPNAGSSTFIGTVSRQWCGQSGVPINGVAGATIQTTGDMAGFHRNDRRDVFGLRWEHDFDKDTQWRIQALYDDKNINQPTGGAAGLQDEPAVNASTDVTHFGSFMGHDVRSYFGVYFNRTRYVSYTGNTLAFGDGAYGATTNKQNAMMQNMGVRGREEIALSPDVTAVLGLAGEITKIAAYSENFGYSAAGRLNSWQPIPVNHSYQNLAPEASVVWRPNSEWQTHVRASSGYGTPYPGQLFVNQQGLNGDNSNLKTQRNTGFDVGFDWTPLETLKVSLTGFHEWYQNEQLTQVPGPSPLQAYTFNAPGSVHRGAELLVDWRPFDGWRLLGNYSYNNQIFTDFTEQLGPSSFFNRAGYKIPNVAAHEAAARIGYDQPYGPFRGLGGYVEYLYKSSYYLDNGNQLTAPGFGIVNVNLHYDAPLAENFLHLKNVNVFFQVQNIFDRTYIASANNITNSVNAAGFQNPGVILFNTAGSIYAGSPRAFQGGVKFKF